jgi:hypothetical protein
MNNSNHPCRSRRTSPQHSVPLAMTGNRKLAKFSLAVKEFSSNTDEEKTHVA